jgi:hypothetical protein
MKAWIEEIDATKEAHVHAVDKADLDIVAEHCQALRNAGLTGTKDDKLAMRCDGFTVMEWCNRKGIAWKEFWRDTRIQTRFIEDPDNAAFRVWTGKL